MRRSEVAEEVRRSTTAVLVAVVGIAMVAVLAGGTTPVLSGTALPAKVRYVKGPATSVPADGVTYKLDGAICPVGWNVVGGGAVGSTLFRVVDSYPTASNGSSPGRRGWTVHVVNTFGGGGAADGNVVAICVQGATTSGTWP